MAGLYMYITLYIFTLGRLSFITKTKPDLDSELNNEHYICQDLCKRSHLVFK